MPGLTYRTAGARCGECPSPAAWRGASGMVLYDGPSMIDGAPILAIATRTSDNAKTGDMVQVWIIRADMLPTEASRAGLDGSICGGCPHRGRMVDGVLVGRSCYVTLFQGPRAVYDAWARGVYPAAESLEHIAELGKGRAVRLGAYGDPAAVPAEILAALVSRAAVHTGYTHQWKSARLAAAYRGMLQASVDSLAEWRKASAAGWGTFLVLPAGASLPDGVTECANARTGITCAECGECDGSGRHIAIHAHGAGAGHVARRALPVLA